MRPPAPRRPRRRQRQSVYHGAVSGDIIASRRHRLGWPAACRAAVSNDNAGGPAGEANIAASGDWPMALVDAAPSAGKHLFYQNKARRRVTRRRHKMSARQAFGVEALNAAREAALS